MSPCWVGSSPQRRSNSGFNIHNQVKIKSRHKRGQESLAQYILADAFTVGSVRSILSNLRNIMAAKLRASFAQIPSATKIRILFFSQSTVGYSPEEENRRLEKLHSTLKVSRQIGDQTDEWLIRPLSYLAYRTGHPDAFRTKELFRKPAPIYAVLSPVP
jgi:hypothetical protein